MSDRVYSLKEFLQLPMPAKRRLMENDPAQYNRLKSQADSNFSTKSDPEALKELMSNPKTKKLVSDE